jgi:predicted transposase/invertase (TIGR01784 family)
VLSGTVDQWYDDAPKEGLKKGLKKGLEQGREQEKLQTACSMKKEGLSVDIIVKCTGLSAAQIKDIQI